MPTVTTATKTIGTAVLAAQTAQSNAVVVSSAIGVTTKFAGVMNVRLGRTTASSMNAPVFRIEGIAAGAVALNDWVPIYIWTTALNGTVSNMQSLQSTNAAGATTLQLSLALGSCLSAPVFIHNTGDVTKSEWNWFKTNTTTPALLNSLNNAQTSGTSQVTALAEMWSIPLDLTGYDNIRLVVDNVWNAVAQPVVVKADLTTLDSTLNT